LDKYTFPDHVGRCNRESNCGYHYSPKQFFADNPDENPFKVKEQTTIDHKPRINRKLQILSHIFDTETSDEIKTAIYEEVSQRECFSQERTASYFAAQNKVQKFIQTLNDDADDEILDKIIAQSKEHCPVTQVEYFDKKTMMATMGEYENNGFVNALQLIFNDEQINNIIFRYNLGTTKDGGVVFWQMDAKERIRYGKRMYYLPDLHRDKSKPPIGIHSLMDKCDFKYRQCFFGEHLLSLPENNNKTVCIVESEKTACICSEAMPKDIWLATGGQSGIKWKIKSAWDCLQGRKVILFPDVDAHKDWTEKSVLFKGFGIDISVDEWLIKVAPNTQYDIADLLIPKLMSTKKFLK